MCLELCCREPPHSSPRATTEPSVRLMSERIRVAQQSCLPVSTVFWSERACQEATEAEGHRGLLRIFLFNASMNMQICRWNTRSTSPRILNPLRGGGLGIYFCPENGSAEWVSYFSSTHDSCFYRLWYTLHGKCFFISFPSFLPPTLLLPSFLSFPFFFAFLMILLWQHLNFHKQRYNYT